MQNSDKSSFFRGEKMMFSIGAINVSRKITTEISLMEYPSFTSLLFSV